MKFIKGQKVIFRQHGKKSDWKGPGYIHPHDHNLEIGKEYTIERLNSDEISLIIVEDNNSWSFPYSCFTEKQLDYEIY